MRKSYPLLRREQGPPLFFSPAALLHRPPVLLGQLNLLTVLLSKVEIKYQTETSRD